VSAWSEHTSLLGQLDGGRFVRLEPGLSGEFSLDPRSLPGGLTEGEHTLRLVAQNRGALPFAELRVEFTFRPDPLADDSAAPADVAALAPWRTPDGKHRGPPLRGGPPIL
jgi:hypothetical protein